MVNNKDLTNLNESLAERLSKIKNLLKEDVIINDDEFKYLYDIDFSSLDTDSLQKELQKELIELSIGGATSNPIVNDKLIKLELLINQYSTKTSLADKYKLKLLLEQFEKEEELQIQKNLRLQREIQEAKRSQQADKEERQERERQEQRRIAQEQRRIAQEQRREQEERQRREQEERQRREQEERRQREYGRTERRAARDTAPPAAPPLPPARLPPSTNAAHHHVAEAPPPLPPASAARAVHVAAVRASGAVHVAAARAPAAGTGVVSAPPTAPPRPPPPPLPTSDRAALLEEREKEEIDRLLAVEIDKEERQRREQEEINRLLAVEFDKEERQRREQEERDRSLEIDKEERQKRQERERQEQRRIQERGKRRVVRRGNKKPSITDESIFKTTRDLNIILYREDFNDILRELKDNILREEKFNYNESNNIFIINFIDKIIKERRLDRLEQCFLPAGTDLLNQFDASEFFISYLNKLPSLFTEQFIINQYTTRICGNFKKNTIITELPIITDPIIFNKFKKPIYIEKIIDKSIWEELENNLCDVDEYGIIEYKIRENTKYILSQYNKGTERIFDNSFLNYNFNGRDYETIGFALKMGSRLGGHWISLVKYKSGWYIANDNNIIKIPDLNIDIEIRNLERKNFKIIYILYKRIDVELKEGEPFGLRNSRNSCWFNSGFQLLLATNIDNYIDEFLRTRNKYLKYKNKYLKLKKLINQN
jgi:hypothetical protein